MLYLRSYSSLLEQVPNKDSYLAFGSVKMKKCTLELKVKFQILRIMIKSGPYTTNYEDSYNLKRRDY